MSQSSEMMYFFRQETEDRVQDLTDQLLELESGAGAAALEILMRAAHSIKGAARVVQLTGVVELAHRLEDCFVMAQRGEIELNRPEQIDAILAAIDWLGELYQQPDIPGWVTTQDAVLEAIQAKVDAIPTSLQVVPLPIETEPLSDSTVVPDAALITAEAAAAVAANPVGVMESASAPELESIDPNTWELPNFIEAGLIRQFMQELIAPVAEWQAALELLRSDNEPPLASQANALAIALQTMEGAARILQLPILPELLEAIAHTLQQFAQTDRSETHAAPLSAQQWQAITQLIDTLEALLEQLSPFQEVEAATELLRSHLDAWVKAELPVWQQIISQRFRPKSSAPLTPPTHKAAVPVPAPSRLSNSGASSGNSVPQPLIQTEPIAAAAESDSMAVGLASESASASAIGADASAARTRSPAPALATPSADAAANRVVRVNTAILNRLMALAGETLVEANWLQPFSDSLKLIRRRQFELDSALSRLQDALQENEATRSSSPEYLAQSQQLAQSCRHELTQQIEDLELYIRRSMQLSDRLYQTVISSNMRPFSDGLQRFPRLVRDLSRRLGKQAQLKIRGRQTPVDRDVLEKLEVPLTHLLQNALDHGIELPEERTAHHKSARGTIEIEAMHRGGMLAITLSDDGKGIDLERLRKKVAERGHLDLPTAQRLNDTELLDFLFLPGFSTASNVTDVSGRGVGLDIVKSMVQEVGGVLRASTELGQGTSFYLQLPLTLSVIRTLMAEISGEPYALPLSRIERIVRIDINELFLVEGRQYFQLDEQNIGLVFAHEVLELDKPKTSKTTLDIVLISDATQHSGSHNAHTYGLIVDRFLGEKELVIRPLDPRLGKVKDVSAAAQMEDGSPLLILDVEDLIRSIEQRLAQGEHLARIRSPFAVLDDVPRKRVLVVDDSITVREVERKLLENKGYDVDVAVNGVDGWNAVRSSPYDLVVSDIDMPRMSGFELVAKIKNDPVLRDLPVVIVSYKDREADRLRGLEVGADYYLTKSSFQDDSLVQAVVDLIGEATDAGYGRRRR